MCGRKRQLPASPGKPVGQSPRARAFTLVEILMAMMVSGIILSAVVSLAWVLGNYQNEGDGRLALATHGRFATTLLTRDLRGARAVTVSSTGGLILWMGDLDNDTRMDSQEFVFYYRPAQDTVIRRLSFSSGFELGPITPASMQIIVNSFDSGSLILVAQAMGLQASNDVVCRNVDSVHFYPNRAMPATKAVEILLSLSCSQNVVADTGRTVTLNLYNSATLRAPYEENGFVPQF